MSRESEYAVYWYSVNESHNTYENYKNNISNGVRRLQTHYKIRSSLILCGT